MSPQRLRQGHPARGAPAPGPAHTDRAPPARSPPWSPGSALGTPPALPPLPGGGGTRRDPAHPQRSRLPSLPLSPSLRTGGQQRGAGRRGRRLADGDEGHVEAELGGRGGEEQVGAAAGTGASPGLRRRHSRAPATSLPRPLPPSPKMAAAAARSREGREAGPAAIPAGRGGGGQRGGGGSGGDPRAGLARGTRRPQSAGSPAARRDPAMPCVGDWLNSPLSIVQGIFGEAGPASPGGCGSAPAAPGTGRRFPSWGGGGAGSISYVSVLYLVYLIYSVCFVYLVYPWVPAATRAGCPRCRALLGVPALSAAA